MLASLFGCHTVQVKTSPPDARVTVDGKDVTSTRSFREGPGLGGHQIKVQREGFKTRLVEVPRDHWERPKRLLILLMGLGLVPVGLLYGVVFVVVVGFVKILAVVALGASGVNGDNPVVLGLQQLVVSQVVLPFYLVPVLALPPLIATLYALLGWELGTMMFRRTAPEVVIELKPLVDQAKGAQQ